MPAPFLPVPRTNKKLGFSKRDRSWPEISSILLCFKSSIKSLWKCRSKGETPTGGCLNLQNSETASLVSPSSLVISWSLGNLQTEILLFFFWPHLIKKSQLQCNLGSRPKGTSQFFCLSNLFAKISHYECAIWLLVGNFPCAFENKFDRIWNFYAVFARQYPKSLIQL